MLLSSTELEQMGQALLDAEPDQEYVKRLGTTSFILAARENKLGMVEAFLKAGIDPDQERPGDGVTALYMAATYGHREMVQLLLDKGADPDKGCAKGQYTTLCATVELGYLDIVRLLLNKGADPNKKRTADGNTPLHEAAGCGRLKIAQLLLDKGADLDEESYNGDTPLHRAVEDGQPEMVQFLLDKGADPNKKRTADGNTPLHGAAKYGWLKIARLLLSEGAALSLRKRNNNGDSPLHLAAKYDNPEMVDFLIGTVEQNGSSSTIEKNKRLRRFVNVRDKEGCSSLLRACHAKSFGAKVILEKGRADKFKQLPGEDDESLLLKIMARKKGVKDKDLLNAELLQNEAYKKWLLRFFKMAMRKEGAENKNLFNVELLQSKNDKKWLREIVASKKNAEDKNLFNVELPQNEGDKNRLLWIVAASGAKSKLLLLELMTEMQMITPEDVSLEKRIQKALENKEWGLVHALDTFLMNHMIAQYHMELLDVACDPTSRQIADQTDSPLLSKEERRGFMRRVGAAYLKEGFVRKIVPTLPEPDTEDPEILRPFKQAIAAIMFAGEEDGFSMLDDALNAYEAYKKNPKLNELSELNKLYARWTQMPKEFCQDVRKLILDMNSQEDVESEDSDSEDLDLEDSETDESVNWLLLENQDGAINQDAWDRGPKSQKAWLDVFHAD